MDITSLLRCYIILEMEVKFMRNSSIQANLSLGKSRQLLVRLIRAKRLMPTSSYL